MKEEKEGGDEKKRGEKEGGGGEEGMRKREEKKRRETGGKGEMQRKRERKGNEKGEERGQKAMIKRGRRARDVQVLKKKKKSNSPNCFGVISKCKHHSDPYRGFFELHLLVCLHIKHHYVCVSRFAVVYVRFSSLVQSSSLL